MNIREPAVVALITGMGSGSKVYQSLLDGHPQIYMIPAYPLMYFYPHWNTWQVELRDSWNWPSVIDKFCEKHASVLDSRKIPGLNGLNSLGESHTGYVSVDEQLFRQYLDQLLTGQVISRRTFLLAVHYAYALCKGEEIKYKKVLVYHIHYWGYLRDYLVHDFPDVKVLGMVRDPRPNLERRVVSDNWRVDDAKLNKTDALIYRKRSYWHMCQMIFDQGLGALRHIPRDQIRVIKHENLVTNLEDTMRSTARFLGVDFESTMLDITFDGKVWWGDKIYGHGSINVVNPDIVSQRWQKTIDKLDWFVIEGLLLDLLKKYEYPVHRYSDSCWQQVKLLIAVLLPSRIERQVLLSHLSLRNQLEFLRACLLESRDSAQIKDYTWNASYLYKWTYVDLRLWESRWYVSLLKYSECVKEKGDRRVYGQVIYAVARCCYVFVNYGRFWYSIISYPAIIMRRQKLLIAYLSRRMKGENILPEVIGDQP